MAKNNIPQDLKFDDLSDYQSIINKLNKRPLSKHLILGNGFSMAYDSKIFSYNALYDFIDKLEDKTLSKLFEVINTKNFELVMRQLDNFIEIAQAFDNTGDMVKALKNANKILQQSLIEAVSSLHPEHVFDIPDEESQSCNNFIQEYLSKGGKVFSTNYDLLLYWILMRNNPQSSIDGFGREHLNPVETKKGEEAQYDD
jgi:predicted house-cleaning noncanonical NTP pyrophosphatase (MazG superfamily)